MTSIIPDLIVIYTARRIHWADQVEDGQWTVRNKNMTPTTQKNGAMTEINQYKPLGRLVKDVRRRIVRFDEGIGFHAYYVVLLKVSFARAALFDTKTQRRAISQ